MLIATHDSATGEKGDGLLSWLLTPFAKTQNKTIKEQYEAGCRMFDIRIKLDTSDNIFYCAHGLWKTKRTALSILYELNHFDDVYVAITYEGDAKHKFRFLEFIEYIKSHLTNIHWDVISIKYGEGSSLFKVKYEILQGGENTIPTKQGFLPLDGRSWHILLPIPILWKKLYHNVPEFSDKYWTFVDFL